ncbi:hypothetical protein [Candidatus Poriferisodalis sp.]|uniref:hypothetical protein n=1 Tax=Candidatus Poriferisodalis sp. TaxID=3101277 RepID=UPI003B025795
MTHAANVIAGYALSAAATSAYVVWVFHRSRKLGRQLGIGSETPPAARPVSAPPDNDASATAVSMSDSAAELHD